MTSSEADQGGPAAVGAEEEGWENGLKELEAVIKTKSEMEEELERFKGELEENTLQEKSLGERGLFLVKKAVPCVVGALRRRGGGEPLSDGSAEAAATTLEKVMWVLAKHADKESLPEVCATLETLWEPYSPLYDHLYKTRKRTRDYTVELVNLFHAHDGFKNLLSRMKKISSIEDVRGTLRPIAQIRNILTAAFLAGQLANDLADLLKSKVTKYLQANKEQQQQQQQLNLGALSDVLRDTATVFRYGGQEITASSAENHDAVVLAVAERLLHAKGSNLEKKVAAVNQVSEITLLHVDARFPRVKSSTKNKQLWEFLKESNIVEELLDPQSIHLELVKRMGGIFTFLTVEDKLTAAHLDALWAATVSAHETIQSAIFGIMETNIVPWLKSLPLWEHIVLGKIAVIPGSELAANRHLVRLVEICASSLMATFFSVSAVITSAQETTVRNIAEPLFDLMWSLHTPLALAQLARLLKQMDNATVVAELRNAYLDKALQDIKDHHDSTPAVKFVVHVLGTPSNAMGYARNVLHNADLILRALDSKYQLMPLVLSDIEHCCAIAKDAGVPCDREEVDARIAFLRMLLERSREARETTVSDVDAIWTLVERTGGAGKEHCYSLLRELGSRRRLPAAVVEYIFSHKIVVSPEQLSSYDTYDWTFFLYIFQLVNWNSARFDLYQPHDRWIVPDPFRLTYEPLQGMDVLWQISVLARDTAVSDNAREALVRVLHGYNRDRVVADKVYERCLSQCVAEVAAERSPEAVSRAVFAMKLILEDWQKSFQRPFDGRHDARHKLRRLANVVVSEPWANNFNVWGTDVAEGATSTVNGAAADAISSARSVTIEESDELYENDTLARLKEIVREKLNKEAESLAAVGSGTPAAKVPPKLGMDEIEFTFDGKNLDKNFDDDMTLDLLGLTDGASVGLVIRSRKYSVQVATEERMDVEAVKSKRSFPLSGVMSEEKTVQLLFHVLEVSSSSLKAKQCAWSILKILPTSAATSKLVSAVTAELPAAEDLNNLQVALSHELPAGRWSSLYTVIALSSRVISEPPARPLDDRVGRYLLDLLLSLDLTSASTAFGGVEAELLFSLARILEIPGVYTVSPSEDVVVKLLSSVQALAKMRAESWDAKLQREAVLHCMQLVQRLFDCAPQVVEAALVSCPAVDLTQWVGDTLFLNSSPVIAASLLAFARQSPAVALGIFSVCVRIMLALSSNQVAEACDDFFDVLTGLLAFADLSLPDALLLSLLEKVTLLLTTRDCDSSSSCTKRGGDALLNGLLSVLGTLLVRSKGAMPQEQQQKLIEELFYRCLFATSQPAKCQAPQSRRLALAVLETLAESSGESRQVITSMLRELMSKLVRDNNRWNYDPRLTQKTHDYCGLRNLGCTCYMNSVLQQLYMTPAFRDRVLALPLPEAPEEARAEDATDDKKKAVSSTAFVSQLQKLFVQMSFSAKNYQDPAPLIKHIKIDGAEVNPLVQMDAEEFLSQMFDLLENNIKAAAAAAGNNDARATSAPGAAFSNFVQEIFGGKLVHQLIPKGCGHVKEREEGFYTLPVVVQGKTDLMASLDAFIEGELLNGNNQYLCEECGTKRDTIKRCLLKHDALPPTLWVHCKRFEYDLENMRRIKVNDRYTFPNEIDLRKYTNFTPAPGLPSYEEQESQRFKYELVGIVVHHGTAESGHYYSYIKRRDLPDANATESMDVSSPATAKSRGPVWLTFNDKVVEGFDVENTATLCFGGVSTDNDVYKTARPKSYNAYMLVYRKCQQGASVSQIPAAFSPPQQEGVASVERIKTSVTTDNCNFALDRHVYDPNFFSFVWNVLGRKGEYLASNWDLASRLLFDVVAHSLDHSAFKGFCSDLADSVVAVSKPDSTDGLLQLFADKSNGWLVSLLLRCAAADTREAFSDLLSSLMIHFVDNNDDQWLMPAPVAPSDMELASPPQCAMDVDVVDVVPAQPVVQKPVGKQSRDPLEYTYVEQEFASAPYRLMEWCTAFVRGNSDMTTRHHDRVVQDLFRFLYRFAAETTKPRQCVQYLLDRHTPGQVVDLCLPKDLSSAKEVSSKSARTEKALRNVEKHSFVYHVALVCSVFKTMHQYETELRVPQIDDQLVKTPAFYVWALQAGLAGTLRPVDPAVVLKAKDMVMQVLTMLVTTGTVVRDSVLDAILGALKDATKSADCTALVQAVSAVIRGLGEQQRLKLFDFLAKLFELRLSEATSEAVVTHLLLEQPNKVLAKEWLFINRAQWTQNWLVCGGPGLRKLALALVELLLDGADSKARLSLFVSLLGLLNRVKAEVGAYTQNHRQVVEYATALWLCLPKDQAAEPETVKSFIDGFVKSSRSFYEVLFALGRVRLADEEARYMLLQVTFFMFSADTALSHAKLVSDFVENSADVAIGFFEWYIVLTDKDPSNIEYNSRAIGTLYDIMLLCVRQSLKGTCKFAESWAKHPNFVTWAIKNIVVLPNHLDYPKLVSCLLTMAAELMRYQASKGIPEEVAKSALSEINKMYTDYNKAPLVRKSWPQNPLVIVKLVGTVLSCAREAPALAFEFCSSAEGGYRILQHLIANGDPGNDEAVEGVLEMFFQISQWLSPSFKCPKSLNPEIALAFSRFIAQLLAVPPKTERLKVKMLDSLTTLAHSMWAALATNPPFSSVACAVLDASSGLLSSFRADDKKLFKELCDGALSSLQSSKIKAAQAITSPLALSLVDFLLRAIDLVPQDDLAHLREVCDDTVNVFDSRGMLPLFYAVAGRRTKSLSSLLRRATSNPAILTLAEPFAAVLQKSLSNVPSFMDLYPPGCQSELATVVLQLLSSTVASCKEPGIPTESLLRQLAGVARLLEALESCPGFKNFFLSGDPQRSSRKAFIEAANHVRSAAKSGAPAACASVVELLDKLLRGPLK